MSYLQSDYPSEDPTVYTTLDSLSKDVQLPASIQLESDTIFFKQPLYYKLRNIFYEKGRHCFYASDENRYEPGVFFETLRRHVLLLLFCNIKDKVTPINIEVEFNANHFSFNLDLNKRISYQTVPLSLFAPQSGLYHAAIKIDRLIKQSKDVYVLKTTVTHLLDTC